MCCIDETYEFSGHSGSSDFSFSKANPVEISPTNEKPVHSVPVKLERSKTESTRPGVLSKEAAKIFDNKIPVQQKVNYSSKVISLFLASLIVTL